MGIATVMRGVYCVMIESYEILYANIGVDGGFRSFYGRLPIGSVRADGFPSISKGADGVNPKGNQA